MLKRFKAAARGTAVLNFVMISNAPTISDTPQRMMGALPFFHVFAMTVVMNFSIALAAEIIIMPRFILDDALKLIDATKPIPPDKRGDYGELLESPPGAEAWLTKLEAMVKGLGQ